MNNQRKQDILLINLAMLCISTSGVLGRYIQMPPEITIFWRASLAALMLFIFCKWQEINLSKWDKKDLPILLGGGILMTIHWVSYFYSLQLANVAICMLAIFTYPIITSILEPLILNTKFEKIHILLGLMTLAGIYFLEPNIDFSGANFQAISLGILSATAYALRNVLMKKSIATHNGSKLMFIQVVIASIILSPFLITKGVGNITEQWWVILLLALFTTVIGHTLFLMSFKRFSVTAASILSCTQPLFGIILAMIFLGEYPALSTLIGGGLILASVIIESFNTKT